MTAGNNPFIEFRNRYYWNPVLFVIEVLGANPDPWQAQFLTAIAAGKRRISVRSGHGVGKSTAVSWAALWWLYTRFPQKTVVTAPTSSQLYDALFAEMKAWLNRMPVTLRGLVVAKTDRIELVAAPDESFISLRTSRAEQPEALQGVHSEHVMLIADEASGVPEAVFEAASGSMSGESAVTILLGNPTRSTGYFYETHTKLKDEWYTMKVSCVDSPRVSREYIREQELRFGLESNSYRVRVLGEFPLADDDTVIPMHLIEAAQNRDVVMTPGMRPVWGLDVARYGSDRTALCKRYGNIVPEPVQWKRGYDTMQTVGWVKNIYDRAEPKDKPSEILVDVIGLGAGVVDRLRELKLPVRGINVSEAPSMGNEHLNLRAELWFKGREWLEARDCQLPDDDSLKQDLATPRYTFTSSGKRQVESKADIKKRGAPSPDLGDAFILTFAGDSVIAATGQKFTSRWNEPIRRNIRRVV
jgi:phage terminase large subunit